MPMRRGSSCCCTIQQNYSEPLREVRRLTVLSCAASRNAHGAHSPPTRLDNAQSRRCGLMEASWRWGLLLILLTMVIHAAAVVTMAFTGLSLRTRLETRNLNLWKLMAIQICVIGVIGTAIGHAARNRVRDLGSGIFVAWRSRL